MCLIGRVNCRVAVVRICGSCLIRIAFRNGCLAILTPEGSFSSMWPLNRYVDC